MGGCIWLSEKLGKGTAVAWLLGAMSAPVAIYAGYVSWQWTLVVGIICTAACLVVQKWGQKWESPMNRWAQLVLLGVVAGVIATKIAPCWGEQGEIMPLTLIVLAVLTASAGQERSCRLCCVTSWILIVLLVVVTAVGIKNIEIRRLAPTSAWNDMLIPVFLIPCVLLFIPHKRGGYAAQFLIPLFGMVISVLCMGTASNLGHMPIYEYSKSLTLLGVAERFEAVTSVAMTLGLHSLLSLLFTAAENLVRHGALLCGGIAVVILLFLGEIGVILTVFTAVMWVFLPLLTALIKKLKKDEKSA
jgi:hypothetical protein